MNATGETTDQNQQSPKQADNPGLSLTQFTEWMVEIEQQPAWRSRADREADYYDGNQLDSAVLQRQREIGMPPAIEPLIGPTIDAVLGMEAKTRTDWRVTPDGDKTGDEVAEALNYKLNQAERSAKADSACSEAYASQIKVGIGWVEVALEKNPFKFKYRCEAVHRNEIWWDMLGKSDMSNARYLIRRRFMHRDQAALMHPDKAELIKHASNGWQSIDPFMLSLDGGTATDLAMAWNAERGWSIEEQQWRDVHHNRVCLFEVWYRIWERALVIRSPDGRVVEYDWNNPMHVESVAAGLLVPEYAVIDRIRLAWYMGPHLLADIDSPYKHNKFPYVPFWGKKEDRTGTPYALIRGMMYLQDEVNARISKMQWGLAAVRTTRTQGAVMDDDETFRSEIARPDADIVLDPDKMSKAGAVFKVERDFQLNEQQFKRLVDAREGIKRTGGIYNSFMGQEGQAQSGVAISGLVEQSNQTLADINDNFKTARSEVGELLLSMIIEDMIGQQEEITIDGEGIRDDRKIRLNVPTVDGDTGIKYLDNDVQRTRLKVALSDTASTPSFRAQQLAAMSEAFKSAPPEYQRVMMPYLFALLDVPNRVELVKALREMEDKSSQGNPLDTAKAALLDAQTRKMLVEAVNKSLEGMFSATQAANQIALVPSIAPMADQMLKSAGFVDQDAAPIMPAQPTGQGVQLPENTHPTMPANPAVGMNTGIEGGQNTGAIA